MHLVVLIHQLSEVRDLVTLYIKLLTICRKNKENDGSGSLLPASLDKLTKEKNVLLDRINQLLGYQNTVKKNTVCSVIKLANSKCTQTV